QPEECRVEIHQMAGDVARQARHPLQARDEVVAHEARGNRHAVCHQRIQAGDGFLYCCVLRLVWARIGFSRRRATCQHDEDRACSEYAYKPSTHDTPSIPPDTPTNSSASETQTRDMPEVISNDAYGVPDIGLSPRNSETAVTLNDNDAATHTVVKGLSNPRGISGRSSCPWWKLNKSTFSCDASN